MAPRGEAMAPKDGQRVAYMSMTEWTALGATQQAIEDDTIDRAAAVSTGAYR